MAKKIGLLVIIAAIYIVLQHFGLLNYLVPSRLADVEMGYGFLFVIGLMTSVHCVAMCGGINLSQCLVKTDVSRPFDIYRPPILYNAGRIASYTIVGFIVGALGSAFSLSAQAQGALKLIAGVFMFVMGINMLGIFLFLRRFTPRMPGIFADKIDTAASKNKTPFIVGLLNGLMPCGPLQAAQLYALSTGSPLKGALSMALFALGTVPLMFVLGTIGSVAGKKSSQKIMAAGAVMVAVLGLCMFTQGWNLFGPAGKRSNGEAIAPIENDNLQIINSTLAPFGYPSITVEPNKPVRWIINAPRRNINGCNYKFFIREYGITHEFKPGENVIEFTPEKEGSFRYTCWMGMIPGTIIVSN